MLYSKHNSIEYNITSIYICIDNKRFILFRMREN